MLPCQSANVHTHSVLLCKEKGKMNKRKKSLETFRKKRKHRNTENPTYLYIMHIGAGQGRRGIDITNLVYGRYCGGFLTTPQLHYFAR